MYVGLLPAPVRRQHVNEVRDMYKAPLFVCLYRGVLVIITNTICGGHLEYDTWFYKVTTACNDGAHNK